MTDSPVSPWLHRWCLLTVCAALVLLGLGSAVTNLKAGMADPIWPTKPTALLDSSPEQLADVRWVVEHSHRLAGYVVGCCTIVLCAWFWLREPRRWLCLLGTAALVGVCFQGLLGGLRVTEHARWGLEFRILHGMTAPIVFGLLVSTALCTSRAWASSIARFADLRRPSLVALAAVYAQIVLGVMLRHTYNPLAQRAHLLVAFVAAIAVVWLIRQTWVSGDRALRMSAVVLAAMLGLQVAVGVETWMTQLGHATVPEMLPVTGQRVAIRTAHVLGGALLLSATLSVAGLARRNTLSAAQPAVAGTLVEAA